MIKVTQDTNYNPNIMLFL